MENINLKVVVPDDYDASRVKLTEGQKPEIIRQSDVSLNNEKRCSVCKEPLDEAAIIEVGQCSACFTCNA